MNGPRNLAPLLVTTSTAVALVAESPRPLSLPSDGVEPQPRVTPNELESTARTSLRIQTIMYRHRKQFTGPRAASSRARLRSQIESAVERAFDRQSLTRERYDIIIRAAQHHEALRDLLLSIIQRVRTKENERH